MKTLRAMCNFSADKAYMRSKFSLICAIGLSYYSFDEDDCFFPLAKYCLISLLLVLVSSKSENLNENHLTYHLFSGLTTSLAVGCGGSPQARDSAPKGSPQILMMTSYFNIIKDG